MSESLGKLGRRGDDNTLAVLVIATCQDESITLEEERARARQIVSAIQQVVRDGDQVEELGRHGICGVFKVHNSKDVDTIIGRLSQRLFNNGADPRKFSIGGIAGPIDMLRQIPHASLHQMALMKLDSARRQQEPVDVFEFGEQAKTVSDAMSQFVKTESVN